MHSTVFLPITDGGATNSTRGSRAVLDTKLAAATWIPGPITPPTNSPSVDTTSKFVLVPKSTTMAGPPKRENAASAFITRSAPTSLGLSVATETPVLIPGPTIRGAKLRYAAAISRNAVVRSGTTLATHMPVRSRRRSRSRCSSSPASCSASSSEVCSARVESRHV